ncbi:MAG: purine-nucleoside phosphorylase [Flavobacteriaceae bacterium]|nr:purine-nucleoside phosphorylase [Flavobacteriaceae bacterium]
MEWTKIINQTIKYLNKKGIKSASLGIILGTGLGKLIKHIEIEKKIPYSEIPNFPISTVEFHAGNLITGKLFGHDIVAFHGRFHLYEGYNYFEITFPIRIMKVLGVSNAIISNAAGAINPSFIKGNLMLVNDHINLQGSSPLALKNIEELGERFVDMSNPYDKKLIKKINEIAREEKIKIHNGTYAAVVGPQLETAAEYRYLWTIGADAVGMSTVPEVIVCNQLKIKTIVFSVLTDECDYKNLKPINIPEIIELAEIGELKLIQIIKKYLTENNKL